MTQNVTQKRKKTQKERKKKKEREEEEEELEIREGVHQRRRKDQRSSWVAARPGFGATAACVAGLDLARPGSA